MGDGVMDFSQIGSGDLTLVGGKAVALAELSRIDGVRVPRGFVVTTLGADVAPESLAAALAGLGDGPYVVRSSATTEDGLGASAAGQSDSYLNVAGPEEVARRIADCRASLFSDRAVAYRARGGDDDQPAMAVVVQRSVDARAAGVLFTADPVSGDRRVTRIDAGRGFGDAIVSGRVTPDVYSVRGDEVVDRRVAERDPVLTDAQIRDLAALGRRIEDHFGSPQDIEWCLDADGVAIVQSRPITTLFPVPAQSDDGNHVYVSVGHQQMMTDAFTPLGLSFWQMTTPRPMAEAGSRLFVDVSRATADRLAMLRASDPLTGDALTTVLDRPGFLAPVAEDAPAPARPPAGEAPAALEPDPEIVNRLIERNRESLARLSAGIEGLVGSALLDAIGADIEELRRLLFDPESLRAIFAGLDASAWLNEHVGEWLGEANVADRLSQSAPHNVTAEMGLALLDVADVVRSHPEVVAFLRDTDDERFLDGLPAVAGGTAARDAILAFLEVYGMRGVGEIDITRPRFAEQPLALVPLILSNVANFAPGAAQRRRDEGLATARATELDLLTRLNTLPDGAEKARQAKARIDQISAFAGYREYPKYGMVNRYAVYKRALRSEAHRLVSTGVLGRPDDIFFLRFEELAEVSRRGRADAELIGRRRAQYRHDRSLVTPRVITSDGEMITGSYRRDDVPAGALAGLAVSGGAAEGRARVVCDLATADLRPGDILVTRYTDPSWTPAFVAIAGLVTEVGGLMTHGAVIAREYGLPAVVAVPGATGQIADGQRIRVDGTAGYIELLS